MVYCVFVDYRHVVSLVVVEAFILTSWNRLVFSHLLETAGSRLIVHEVDGFEDVLVGNYEKYSSVLLQSSWEGQGVLAVAMPCCVPNLVVEFSLLGIEYKMDFADTSPLYCMQTYTGNVFKGVVDIDLQNGCCVGYEYNESFT